MIWIVTLACIVGLYVLGSIIFSLLTLVVVSWPIIQVGRWIQPLSLPTWFLARYLSFGVNVAAMLWVTQLAGTYLDVWLPALYMVVAIMALQLFNTLYQFDLMLFQSQSGPWSPHDEVVA